MSPLHVRLNFPGFNSKETWCLQNPPSTLTGIACSVLEQIGGFGKEELEEVRSNVDKLPLTIHGELCEGNLIELTDDARLGVFLTSASSPESPAVIEVRPAQTAEEPSLVETSRTTRGELTPVAAPLPSPLAPQPQSQERQPNGTSDGFRCGDHSSLPLWETAQAGDPQHSDIGDEARRYADSDHRGVARSGEVQQPSRGAVALESVFASERAAQQAQQAHSGRSARGTPRSALQGGVKQLGLLEPPPLRVKPGLKAGGQFSRTASAPSLLRRPGGGDQPDSRLDWAGSRRTPQGQVHTRLYDEAELRKKKASDRKLQYEYMEDLAIRESAEKARAGLALNDSTVSARSRDLSPRRDMSPRRAVSPIAAKQDVRPTTKGADLDQHGQPLRGPPGRPGRTTSSARPDLSLNARGEVPASPMSLGRGSAQADASGIGPAGTPGGEERSYGDSDSLQHVARAQRERIDFLESRHREALRDLKKVREELQHAHQQRFREADKASQLEQLVGEMQGLQFNGDYQLRARWEDWLQRSRMILEAD